MGAYRFVTVWHIRAPRTDVWAALRDPLHYPDWWPGMTDVEVLDPGASDGTGQHVRMTTRSRLPYRLRFETIAREVHEPDRIVVDSVRELEGAGRWELEEQDELTVATYTWEVATTKPWMNVLEPFARPVFTWNHHVIMQWGGEGLARHLGGHLEDQTHFPTVRAADWLPLAGLSFGCASLAVRLTRRDRRGR